MKFNKMLLSTAFAASITGALVAPAHAAQIDMSYDGLATMLTSSGAPVGNTSNPYYYDTTWGYGLRTQICGTMSFDTVTGFGTGTVTPFEFFDAAGPAVFSDVSFQSIGGGLMLGNMNINWNASDITTNIVLDASGLFSALDTGLPPIGTTLDDAACGTYSLACALPASDNIRNGSLAIGVVPIATSSYNVAGSTGYGTTLGQLSLGADDGIGGSPMDNGPFSGFNANFDMTSITVTCISTPEGGCVVTPIPAAVWLFGSGVLALVGVARRRKTRYCI